MHVIVACRLLYITLGFMLYIIFCRMTNTICTTRYHHGGQFLRMGRRGTVRYINGTVIEFDDDIDRLCYWGLLGTIKFLGYDISKSTKVYYLEARKTMTCGLMLIHQYGCIEIG